MQRTVRWIASAIATVLVSNACAKAIGAQPEASGECVVNAPGALTPEYLRRVAAMNAALGVPHDYASTHALVPEPVAAVLVNAGHDVRGRTVRLAPVAASALHAMISAAARDDVVLRLVSGYRSTDYQVGLLRAKLRSGMDIQAALRINAAPGYSEHHTGCAVDLTTPGVAPAETSFAGTRAYRWMLRHAGEFGFHLSYPRGNPHGIEFEPWHWRFVAGAPQDHETRTPASAKGKDQRLRNTSLPPSASTRTVSPAPKSPDRIF